MGVTKIRNITMTNQLDLFAKSQPTDISILDDMVSPIQSQLDWDINQAEEAGDTQRVHELITIKNDMNQEDRMNIVQAMQEILAIIESHSDEELKAILEANDKKILDEETK